MRAFIIKLARVSFAFSIGTLSFIFIIHGLVRYMFDFTLPDENKYLIFGHSQPECAFNDNIILGFKNLSRSGESYFYTFQKTKEVLPANDVTAVFIEYTNNVLSKEMDDWIWGYEKMNAFYPWHAPSMNKEDMLYLYKNNPKDFPKVLSTSIRNNLTRIISLDLAVSDRYGRYNKLQRSNIDKLIKNRDINPVDTTLSRNIFFNNLNYLDKIINYCHENNIEVYLVRSPQHKYHPRENEKALHRIKNQRYKDINFLDFDTFPLEDNEYGDFAHLNYKGAKIFSLWFNDLIENGLLISKNKEEFVKREIQKYHKLHNQGIKKKSADL